MSDLRSRAGVFGVTSGAAVLLALPVVASGQVPGVDQVVGGVNHAAQGVVQAAPAPPVRLPAPAPAPAPRPAPAPAAAPAPSAPAPSYSAPATSTSTRSTMAGASVAPRGGSGGSGVQASASGKKRHAAAGASSDEKAAASQDSTSSPTDVQIADQTADVPEDASPATLPFTGLQLMLMGLAGLAAVAVGGVLRRAT
jgi:hypothetical protein